MGEHRSAGAPAASVEGAQGAAADPGGSAPGPARPPPLAELLHQPAPVALRWLCESLLDQAGLACSRLRDTGDDEALHDLRVALRRLRSQLRAYAALLPAAGARKQRRRVRELAQATSEARDLEVQLAWLRRQRHTASGAAAREVDELTDQLARRLSRALSRARAEAADRLPPLSRKLSRRLLQDQAAAVAGPPGPRFFAAAAERIRAEAVTLAAEVSRIGSPLDEEQAHRARIVAKRLRYLVEPLRAAPPDTALARRAEALVERIKELQDVLGDLHDAHVMGHLLEDALALAKGGPPANAGVAGAAGPEEGGLRWLDSRVVERRDHLFARFQAARDRLAVDDLVAAAEELADGLG